MIAGLFVLAFVPMVLEARLSRRHDGLLRVRGATEPAGDAYRLMQFAYPAGFLAMTAEAWMRGASFDFLFSCGLLVFLAAKGLKYWAIATLGERWTFRVLVPPGSSRIADGPYRVLRHPNYVAVIGEHAGFALMAHAGGTGPAATAFFAALIWMRIRVEERALNHGLSRIDTN